MNHSASNDDRESVSLDSYFKHFGIENDEDQDRIKIAYAPFVTRNKTERNDLIAKGVELPPAYLTWDFFLDHCGLHQTKVCVDFYFSI